ncbi:MAG: hypothetical protein M3139_18510, partial [Bacteroidota bacterium]|nr:hypothetical protein [Bacteroidota bacterium]
GSKFFLPLTINLHPDKKKNTRIHITDVRRKIWVRFGSFTNLMPHIIKATGSIVITKIIIAQPANILPRKFFNIIELRIKYYSFQSMGAFL